MQNKNIKFKLIFLAILFFGIFGLAKSSLAACTGSSPNLTAASNSYTDVNACVSASTYGDTISVPAGSGSVTWSSQLVITKGITLQGAGAGNLTITGTYADYLISYEPDSTSISNDTKFRLTGFTFNTGSNPSIKIYNPSFTTIINNIIIDNNVITNTTDKAIEIYGMINGVIYQNTIGTGELSIEFTGRNQAEWEHRGYYPGTAGAMYIEDNSITNTNNQTQMIGWAGGGIGIVRYNTLYHTGDNSTQSLFDMHGNLDASGNYGTIAAEIYGNKLVKTYPNNYDSYFYQRGGAALFFFNYSNGTYNDGLLGAYIHPYEEIMDSCHPTTGSYPSGNNQVTGQPQKVNNSYYWNNRTSDRLINVRSTATDDSINCCYGDLCTYDVNFVCTSCGANLRIKQDREFFKFNTSFNGTSGVGCGTLANRPATCSPGDGSGPGYWATNQSCSDLAGMVGTNPTTPISGTLYKCTATNTWTSYYTPYTYPHPLRNEIDTTPPASPTGLTVQ